jgi:predicted aldo/keto reductase-like oxidoreductase
MQLPLPGGAPANIDETESIRMLRYAIDHGVNYLSLGYPEDLSQYEHQTYPIRQALQDGYRQKIKIAASLPSFLINSSRDLDRYLNEQLRCLQMERLDFYLLGGLDWETWPRLQGLDVLRWAEGAMVDGRIDKLGFSLNDHFQVLRGILDAYDDWTLCQFRYSYMDVDHHPGTGGLKYAAEKGLAVVVAEPLLRGRLTKEPPEPVARVWAVSSQRRTLPEWGLRWVWDHPEVATVVSDMSTMEQVIENMATADTAAPDSLTVQEQVLISRVREAYRKLRDIPCTSCHACMPCPQGIDVPRIFELHNDAIMYSDAETSRRLYHIEQHHIDKCNECGDCVKRCGRMIAIPERLRAALRRLAKNE